MNNAYKRYRKWATKFGQKQVMLLGGAMGAVGYAVILIFGVEKVLPILPWFAFIGGPIAAFDAWGAANHRGKPIEGFVRAMIIIVMFWALAGFIHFNL